MSNIEVGKIDLPTAVYSVDSMAIAWYRKKSPDELL